MKKLTEKQRKVLQMLADGWTLIWMSGVRCNPYSYARRGNVEHETVRVDYVSKFHTAGWIERFSDPATSWRSADYRITESGRNALLQP